LARRARTVCTACAKTGHQTAIKAAFLPEFCTSAFPRGKKGKRCATPDLLPKPGDQHTRRDSGNPLS